MDQALSPNFQGLAGSKVVCCNCVHMNVRKGREHENEARLYTNVLDAEQASVPSSQKFKHKNSQ